MEKGLDTEWEREEGGERENATEIVNGSASIRSRVFRNHCYVK